MKTNKTITFDKSAKNFVLNTFDKSVDKDGYIVEKKNPKQRVIAQDGQEVEFDKFAGIKKRITSLYKIGSRIYYKAQ